VIGTGAILLIVALIVFMAIGAPVYLSILLASFATILNTGGKMHTVVQRLYTANDNFPLLAIPFFFMAGELMLQGGISRRIVNFARSLLSWVRGSMAVITMVSCAFFGAISGSSYATTVAIGKIMYPEMLQEGYEAGYAAVLQAVGGTLGVLIPPSILCVLYGVATGSSVGDMLLYIAPAGILTMLAYIGMALWLIRKKSVQNFYVPVVLKPDSTSQKVALKKLGADCLEAFWALLSPVIILGGIYMGIFTPTECAIVATIYSWLVGTFVYRELNPKTTCRALTDSVVGSACVIIIVDAANVFSWLLTVNNVARAVAAGVSNTVSTPVSFLLLINIVYFIAGMFVEGSVTITIITPLLFPVAKSFGINPIHFGVVTILNCIIGTLTPPFGGALFVTTGFTKVPVITLVKRVWPFVMIGMATCLMVTYIPLLWL
jgi:C4-dicarboxylate transporter DctM subunit